MSKLAQTNPEASQSAQTRVSAMAATASGKRGAQLPFSPTAAAAQMAAATARPAPMAAVTSPETYRGFLHAVTHILRSGGPLAFYQGVVPNVLGSGMAWGTYFFRCLFSAAFALRSISVFFSSS